MSRRREKRGTPPGHVRPACPDCAYDVSGQIESSDRDLDREVVCSECGRRMRVREAIATGIDVVRPRRLPGWLGVTTFLVLASLMLLLIARLAGVI